MKKVHSVEEYLEDAGDQAAALEKLRKVIIQTELEETVKWSAPTYTLKGKNVLGLGAFKSYVGIWFFQGVFLKDPQGVLINAQDGKTKAMRQWRFQSADEINPGLVHEYVLEAIENQRQGLEMKPERRSKEVVLPDELKAAFADSGDLKANFEALTPFKQRELAEHVASAKKAETRERRLLKVLDKIRQGVGLHDQYR